MSGTVWMFSDQIDDEDTSITITLTIWHAAPRKLLGLMLKHTTSLPLICNFMWMSILLVTKAHALPTLCLNTLLIRKREKLNVGSLNLRFPKPLLLRASAQ